MDDQKYYKICRIDYNEKLKSVSIHGDYSIEYTPGIWITPKIKGSKIFIFDALEYAYDFDNTIVGKTQIWEVEAEEVSSIKTMLWSDSLNYQLELFWKDGGKCGIKGPPFGTAGASRIKLLKLVE